MTSVDDYHTALIARKEQIRKNADFNMVNLVMKGFKTTGIAIGVWLWGYLGMSVAWVFVVLFFHIVSEEVGRQIKSKRKFALQSMNSEKGAILSRVDEKQSWIYFPELEKAEWLNKMIKQLWPVIADYAETLIMTTIQECIQANLPSNLGNFKFSEVDMGDIPMRIEWVKVYIEESKKEQITMDLNIKYQGDASIKCEVKGISFGIKSLQVKGDMRVVMNPLITEVPIVGGLSAFFLNTPDINFDMLAAASILDLPVIKRTIRDIVSKVVSDMLVLPRRIPISLSDKVDLTNIRYPPADGLVVVHVVEAKDLKAADVGVMSKPKSDPYCSIIIGNQVMSTKVISNKLNPYWDEYFQAVVDQRHGQSVEVRVFDKDQGSNNDDELGNAFLDIDFISKKNQVDMWLPLANVATGSLHVRALWMDACTTMREFKPSAQVLTSKFANAILLVVVETACEIPSSPNTGKARNPYVVLRLGDDVKVTSVKNSCKDPVWNENFNYFLSDPQNQQLDLKLMHKGSSKEMQLGHIVVPVNVVLLDRNFTMVKKYSLPEMGDQCSLTVRFVLRVLKSRASVEEWSDYSSVASLGYGVLMKPNDDGGASLAGTGGGGLMNIDFGELAKGQEDVQAPADKVLAADAGAGASGGGASASSGADASASGGGASDKAGGGGGASDNASGGGGASDNAGGGGGGGASDNAGGGASDKTGGGGGASDKTGGGGGASDKTGGGGGASDKTGGGGGASDKTGGGGGSGASASASAGGSGGAGVSGDASGGDSGDAVKASSNTKTTAAGVVISSDTGTQDGHKQPPLVATEFVSLLDTSLHSTASKFGQLQLTIRYSSNRSTLVLVVHQCRNLIPCDKDNLADPYIRTYLLPDRSSDTKRKTKVVKNSLNPVFDETFEWALGNMELPFRGLEVAVKNDVGMFSRGRVQMGMVLIKLSQLDNPSQALTQWFDLEEGE